MLRYGWCEEGRPWELLYLLAPEPFPKKRLCWDLDVKGASISETARLKAFMVSARSSIFFLATGPNSSVPVFPMSSLQISWRKSARQGRSLRIPWMTISLRCIDVKIDALPIRVIVSLMALSTALLGTSSSGLPVKDWPSSCVHKDNSGAGDARIAACTLDSSLSTLVGKSLPKIETISLSAFGHRQCEVQYSANKS